MDRYEVPMDAHLAPLVEAAERGDEVVITEAGRVVARVASAPEKQSPEAEAAADTDTDARCLRELSELFRSLPGDEVVEAARLVREMRDEERF